jgi:hypothetical protein
VEHANDVPADERAGAASAVQELWDNTITDDVLLTLGSVSWVVAVVGAAVACRSAGASMTVVVLLALSALVAVHAPPVGPIALVCFAAAAALIARSRRPSATPAL